MLCRGARFQGGFYKCWAKWAPPSRDIWIPGAPLPGTFLWLCQPLQGAKSAGHRVSLLWTMAPFQELEHGTWSGSGCATPVGFIWLWQVLPKWVQSVLGGRRCFPLEDLPFPPTLEASCVEWAVSNRAWDEKFSRHHTPSFTHSRDGVDITAPIYSHSGMCIFPTSFTNSPRWSTKLVSFSYLF